MVEIPPGSFLMGGDDVEAHPEDGEGPVRRVDVSAFAVDACAVSNEEFARFVAATGHVTDAERIGWSFVFDPHGTTAAPGSGDAPARVPAAPWWAAVRGAAWHCPEGPGSDLARREDHPVVHVSWNDAARYARWAGGRLLTEAEWERAARGGLDRAVYPWGDRLRRDDGSHRCNIWQGEFPRMNTAEDGFAGTAPVDAFAPNGYGLYNMSGNVWEWCADWWSATWHVPDRPATRRDPAGPRTGSERVIRGGSFLCHDSYCNRYRVAARSHNAPGSSASNTGFRCGASV